MDVMINNFIIKANTRGGELVARGEDVSDPDFDNVGMFLMVAIEDEILMPYERWRLLNVRVPDGSNGIELLRTNDRIIGIVHRTTTNGVVSFSSSGTVAEVVRTGLVNGNLINIVIRTFRSFHLLNDMFVGDDGSVYGEALIIDEAVTRPPREGLSKARVAYLDYRVYENYDPVSLARKAAAYWLRLNKEVIPQAEAALRPLHVAYYIIRKMNVTKANLQEMLNEMGSVNKMRKLLNLLNSYDKVLCRKCHRFIVRRSESILFADEEDPRSRWFAGPLVLTFMGIPKLERDLSFQPDEKTGYKRWYLLCPCGNHLGRECEAICKQDWCNETKRFWYLWRVGTVTEVTS